MCIVYYQTFINISVPVPVFLPAHLKQQPVPHCDTHKPKQQQQQQMAVSIDNFKMNLTYYKAVYWSL